MQYIDFALSNLKKHDEAIVQFQKASSLSKGYENELYLAETYDLKGDIREAVKYYKLFLSNLGAQNSNFQHGRNFKEKKKIAELKI
ncbi:hypothetical protein [Aequorivita antarctica]|uniref:Tetratricopeptide repeat protein n=1 Tax=Aequorivita antarctica TaxID=153266 RepID=A0A5C6Z0X8_9FLAO|nr:hypothetical protein [Aequorivita antarctica]TXD73666.1 hypothetical protein ESU54_07850 [Aequorivita antarctica]SRX75112.1 hypothetical protein AEQU3_02100 [Aequorivita antarctica]